MINSDTITGIRNGISIWLNRERERVAAIGERMVLLRDSFSVMPEDQMAKYLAPNGEITLDGIKAGLIQYVDDQITLENTQAQSAAGKYDAMIARQKWVIDVIGKAENAPDENAADAVLAGVEAQMEQMAQAKTQVAIINAASIQYLQSLRMIVENTPTENFAAWLGG